MQKQNIADVLTRMGYDVDIFVLEMGNDTVLDGVPFKAGSRRSIADIYEFISVQDVDCLLYTSPSPRDGLLSRMPSSA